MYGGLDNAPETLEMKKRIDSTQWDVLWRYGVVASILEVRWWSEIREIR